MYSSIRRIFFCIVQLSCVNTFLVLHPLPGSKIKAKIIDKNGVEVPASDYDLEIDGEDFTFKFKKPHRSRSGKYTLVFSNEGAETEQDIFVNFLGKILDMFFCTHAYFLIFRCPNPTKKCFCI